MATYAPSSDDVPGDELRLLLAIADHLFEHCACTTDARCVACDLRAHLMDVRDRMLAWRAAGRRLSIERGDAVANGHAFMARQHPTCVECEALARLSGLVTPECGHGEQ